MKNGINAVVIPNRSQYPSKKLSEWTEAEVATLPPEIREDIEFAVQNAMDNMRQLLESGTKLS